MIESLDKKITKKEWVAKTSRESAEGTSEEYLIVESKEGYEFIIVVDNEKETAEIMPGSKTAGEKYTITYDPNGGIGEVETIEVRSGFNKILKNNTYTREDYIFAGWCENPEPDGEATIYSEGSKYPVKRNVTLYAIWNLNVVTITFDANTGMGSMNPKKVTKKQDTKLPVNTFTKEYYDFVKWNTKADGTGTDYEDSAIIKMEDNITLYAIWKSKPITAEDIKNKPSSFYGSIVTNYSAKTINGKDYNNAVANWKIFYADDTNIYLIADDYIHYDYCPSSATKTIYKNSDYKLSFNNVTSDYPNGSSHIIDTRIKALNNDYFNEKKYSSTNKNMQAVAYMLDTNVWSGYAGIHADYAIGGPTIELLTTSYNQKNKTNYKVQARSNIGYQISEDGGINWANWYTGTLNKNDSLYVIKSTEKAEGMWLASPTANTSMEHIASTYYNGGFGSIIYNYNLQGFRPMVCLKSTVQLKKEADGVYAIKEN